MMPNRLSDYGYSVSTGPLVWNRHKPQLRTRKSGRNIFPVVWAESVTPDGQFNFSATKRNHVPYIQVEDDQGFLIVREPCVLIQRTTAKEQDRRLIAAVMPQKFLTIYGNAVVENHLNMARQIVSGPIQPETISALLNSRAVDQTYRCISGSVAVSAYELEALPLPSMQQMLVLQTLVSGGASREVIDHTVERMYGMNQ
jgi:adenine-specific DNA-methyltransferase